MTTGEHAGLDGLVEGLLSALGKATHGTSDVRRIVAGLGVALQANLLLRYGNPAVTDAFLQSRLVRLSC